jgi:hypothetical protein
MNLISSKPLKRAQAWLRSIAEAVQIVLSAGLAAESLRGFSAIR